MAKSANHSGEVKCAQCHTYMHPKVLEAHMIRKHKSATSPPNRISGAQTPSAALPFDRISYERWKVEMRKLMHCYQHLITSILTKFNEPLGTKPLPEAPISCKLRKMFGDR